MKNIIIDNETTGLRSKDEVIQFAALVCDEKFRIVRIVNFYCDTVYPISAEAQRITGLDFEKIHHLSNGLTFEDQWIAFIDSLRDEKDITWIEWSSNGFDARMINQTLKKCGLKPYNFGKEVTTLGREGICHLNLLRAICNLCYNGSPRKLVVACRELLNTTEAVINNMYNSKIKTFDVNTGAHHADYDAFLCYLLLITYGDKMY